MAPAVLLPLCAFDAPAGEYTTSLGTTGSQYAQEFVDNLSGGLEKQDLLIFYLRPNSPLFAKEHQKRT